LARSRIVSPAAPALVGEREARVAEPARDGPGGRRELRDVGRRFGHRAGDRVRGEDERRALPRLRRYLGERSGGAIRHGGEEALMLAPRRRVDDLGGAGHARAGGADVGHVALPRCLAAERRQDQADRAATAIGGHGGERFVQKRMPVPHPDVDRQRAARPRQRGAQPGRLSLRERVER